MAQDTQTSAIAETATPVAPAPLAGKAPRKRPAKKNARKVAPPAGVTREQYGQALGIGGPNGTPIYAGETLLSARVTIAPVSDDAGIVTALVVTIPGVAKVTLPFMGADTVRYVAGLFRKHAVRAAGNRNRSDADQMALGLLPALAGGQPGIWTGRRNGSGTATPQATMSEADLASLLAPSTPAKARARK